MALSQATIARLFPHPLPTYEELEARYPKRDLPDGARVTRFAPSPTGFLHIGGVMTSLICERMAHQSEGVFFLRLEDTDQKREVEGAKELILRSLEHFGIRHDEGQQQGGSEKGAYGPYTQSKRKEIYHAYIKYLLEKGDAYVCFATPEELEENVKKQMSMKQPLGYWGSYALWREKSEEEVVALLDTGTPFVIRMRSPGTIDRKVRVKDMLRGTLEFPENLNDVVIMKGDGLPTYHFAHAVDDHLMRTTHVIRSDEWVPSLPMHIQLFLLLGFEVPTYAHVAPIQKMEESSRRKLSKRKDAEANVEFYEEKGYPAHSVIEYVLNLANSKFEDWRRANPKLAYTEYLFDPKNVNNSGCLLDFVKLDSVSSGVIARMNIDEVWANFLPWAKKFDAEFAEKLLSEEESAKAFLNIERDGAIPRKDIAAWSSVREQMAFLFDAWFEKMEIPYLELLGTVLPTDALRTLELFSAAYDPTWDQETWLSKVKEIAVQVGYAASPKELKEAPEGTYKGHFGSIAMVIRIAITGSVRSPELSRVMAILGKEKCLERMARMKKGLS